MRILVIGKIQSEVSEACRIAMDNGAKISNAENIEEGFKKVLAGDGAETILVDIEDDVEQLIKLLKQERISTPVVAYGINADSRKATQAIKAGAEEYLPLPPEEELIVAILESITEESNKVISASPQMQEIISLAERIAPSDASVLVTGESGTGKEVIARLIHRKSSRSSEKFVSVNCAAIPDNLLESELFGHEKGAFTGALNKRIGKFEESNNGTLLLDEISEMDLRLQAKLLRAIQEKEIVRVGGNSNVKINLRVVATSNRDLKKEVAEGRFREDLMFRLNVIHLQLPPLRERKEDLKDFAEHFAEKYAESNGIETPEITNDALSALNGYDWPGNVRELENTMHRAVLLNNSGKIDKTSLLMESSFDNIDSELEIAEGVDDNNKVSSFVGQKVSEMEKALILQTVDSVSGNRSKAANILGISIRTLHNKLREYEKTQE